MRVFIAGATSNGTRVRERGLGQDVVREAMCQPRKRVGRERGDDEQVEPAQMRVRVVARGAPRERGEGLGRHEPLGARGEHGVHLVSGANEQPDERAGLVGRDPTGHAEQDARHAPLPQLAGASCLIFPFATSSIAIVR